eukprot:1704575-Karenia_brevis.AAC.1
MWADTQSPHTLLDVRLCCCGHSCGIWPRSEPDKCASICGRIVASDTHPRARPLSEQGQLATGQNHRCRLDACCVCLG